MTKQEKRAYSVAKGFTLIEAMVAMVIVSIVLLSLGAFTVTVVRSDNTAKQRTVATHVAEQALEKWYGNNVTPNPAVPVTIDNTTYQFQSFDATPVSGVSSKTLTGSGPTADMRAITVYWRNSTGIHTVTVANMRRVK